MRDYGLGKRVLRCLYVCAAGVATCLATSAADAKLGDQVYKTPPSDAIEDDEYAYCIDVDGPLAIVGAGGRYYSTLTTSRRVGAAYVLDAMTGERLTKLVSPDAEQLRIDHFGVAVGISGSNAVVGTMDAAYAFDAVTGAQLSKLTPSDTPDEFGFSVAVDGTVAAVRSSDGAYLFDVTTGQQLQKLSVPHGSGRDREGGHEVAISREYVLVGDVEDRHAGRMSGAAYLFDVDTGTQLMKLTPSDARPYQEFGSSMSIDGNRALIAAPGGDGDALAEVYLFDLTTGEELLKLFSPRPTWEDARGQEHWVRFGATVVLTGNRALIGAPDDDEVQPCSGAAYLFDVTSGDLLAKFKAADAERFDLLGYSVAMNDRVALAGVTNDGGTDYHNYIYAFSLVPEPMSGMLLGVGAAWLGVFAARQRRRQQSRGT